MESVQSLETGVVERAVSTKDATDGFDGLSEADRRKLRTEIEKCVPELGYEWARA